MEPPEPLPPVAAADRFRADLDGAYEETIAAFHAWYTQGTRTGQKVIGNDPATTRARLFLCRALVQVLANGLAGNPRISEPGEITVLGGGHEFYDFEAKYLDDSVDLRAHIRGHVALAALEHVDAEHAVRLQPRRRGGAAIHAEEERRRVVRHGTDRAHGHAAEPRRAVPQHRPARIRVHGDALLSAVGEALAARR